MEHHGSGPSPPGAIRVVSGFERFRKYGQSLRGHFHHYRHAWLAIGLLALLILILGQAPSEEMNEMPDMLSEAAGNHTPSQPDAPTAPSTANPAAPGGETSDPGSAQKTPAITTESQHQQNSALANASSPDSTSPTLVLIIDDIGNNLAAGMRAVALPGKVTLAVMPYTPHGTRIAEAANSTGQEVMLHMPMSNQSGMNLGPDGLTPDLDETETTRRLRLALANVPYVKGVNNHTGSELTELPEPMKWVMKELSHHSLYFIDSMTTAQSVAFDTAQQFSIPALKRHVFLDNVREEAAIHTQFEQAVKIAQQEGLAVAIGHPYEETLIYLEKALPALEKAGVELHFASELLSRG